MCLYCFRSHIGDRLENTFIVLTRRLSHLVLSVGKRAQSTLLTEQKRELHSVNLCFTNDTSGENSSFQISLPQLSARMASHSTTQVCYLCHRSLSDGGQIQTYSKCQHGFHRDCLQMRLTEKDKKCPQCTDATLAQSSIRVEEPPTYVSSKKQKWVIAIRSRLLSGNGEDESCRDTCEQFTTTHSSRVSP